MMLGRQLVDMARRRGVRHVEARRRQRVGRPDRREGAAAAVGDPDARILAVEARPRIVEPDRAALGQHGAAAALDLDVVDQRGLARPPQQGRGARIDAAGPQPEPGHDRVAAPRALDQRLGAADAHVGRALVGQVDMGQARMQRDQHAVGPQLERVADAVAPHRQVEHAVAVDRALERRRVVGLVVALDAQVADIDPLGHRRQRADRRLAPRRHLGERGHRHVGRKLARRAEPGELEAMGKVAHAVVPALAGDDPAAVAKAGEHRGVARHRVVEPDLGEDAVLVRDHHARPG